MEDTAKNTTFSEYVDQAREEVIDEYIHGYATADEIVAALEGGEWWNAANDYADGHNHYVHATNHHHLLANGLLDPYMVEADEHTPVAEGDSAMRVLDRLLSTATYLMLIDAFRQGTEQAVCFMAADGSYAAQTYVDEHDLIANIERV